jgi:hypothetical protein
MLAWITRHITLLIGIAVAGTILGIGIASAFEPTTTASFVAARQLYGLTALGVLLSACLIAYSRITRRTQTRHSQVQTLPILHHHVVVPEPIA